MGLCCYLSCIDRSFLSLFRYLLVKRKRSISISRGFVVTSSQVCVYSVHELFALPNWISCGQRASLRFHTEAHNDCTHNSQNTYYWTCSFVTIFVVNSIPTVNNQFLKILVGEQCCYCDLPMTLQSGARLTTQHW